MKSLDGKDGPAAVSFAKERLQKYESHNSYYQDGGEYLPLSVCSSRGFDADAIKLHSQPEDVKEHSVLGTCYRVSILSTGRAGQQGQKRESEGEVVDRRRKRARTLNDNGEASTASGSGIAGVVASVASGAVPGHISASSGGCSSSSSDSSSSSSHAKKKKRSKKSNKSKKSRSDKKRKTGQRQETKAEKRAREQQERFAEKAKAKLQNEKKKVAEQLLCKAGSASVALEAIITKEEFKHVPSLISDPAMKALASLKSIQDAATKVVQDNGESELPISDAKVRNRKR